jgi:hypothetical protein
MHLIWVSGEGKYFCKRGWTSHFGKHEVICPSGKISSSRPARQDYFPSSFLPFAKPITILRQDPQQRRGRSQRDHHVRAFAEGD